MNRKEARVRGVLRRDEWNDSLRTEALDISKPEKGRGRGVCVCDLTCEEATEHKNRDVLIIERSMEHFIDSHFCQMS